MESAVLPTYEPFFKLAQSNMALFTEFWMSPTSTIGPADAFSRLVKGAMENYSRFLVELTQSASALNRRF